MTPDGGRIGGRRNRQFAIGGRSCALRLEYLVIFNNLTGNGRIGPGAWPASPRADGSVKMQPVVLTRRLDVIRAGEGIRVGR
jgi:hypothetical protein